MSKVKGIGLIVEDNSDYESFKKIIHRIINKNNIPIKKAIGNGCGKLKRKATSYAQILFERGCNMIILVHDLDRNDLNTLKNELEESLEDSPAQHNLVCIPIEELEGWFLSDPETIRDTFGLVRVPSFHGNPQNINSPKERLGEQIYICSNKSRIYLNTKHNTLLAEKISIEKMTMKCNSFKKFHDFLLDHEY